MSSWSKGAPTALVVVFVGLGGLACGAAADLTEEGGPPAERHTAWRRVRVASSDAETGLVSIFDAEDDEVTATLPAPRGRLVASASGQHAVLVPADGSAGRLLWAGVSIVDHVDHIHIYKYRPELRLPMGDASPSHVASSGAAITITSRAEGASRVVRVDEEEAVKDPAKAPRTIDDGTTVVRAAPLDVATLLVAADGRILLERDGISSPVGATCRGTGATATAPGRVVLDCEEGLVRIALTRDDVTTTTTPRPEPLRSLTCAPLDGACVAVGESGRAWLASLPSDALGPLAIEGPVCDAELDPGMPGRTIALAASGKLYVFEGSKSPRVMDVVTPFSCAAGRRPHLAIAPDRAYLSVPSEGVLKDVDLLTGAVVDHAVGGAPSSLVVLGVDIRNANVAPGAEH